MSKEQNRVDAGVDTRRQSVSPPTRQTTEDSTKSKKRSRKSSADIRRHETTYKNWERAKKEFRGDLQKQNVSKIELQRELIQKQADYHDQSVKKQEQVEAKRRQKEQEAKRARDNALMQICRDSLHEDERRAKLRRRKRQTSRGDAVTVSRDTITDEARSMRRTRGSQITRTSMSSWGGEHTTTFAPSPMTEEGTEASMAGLDSEGSDLLAALTEEELASLPRHHLQLYQMYGKAADHWLHPKLEQKPKRSLSSKLKEHRGTRLGADELWELLRGDSHSKLQRADASIPPELKSAFGAFVRQYLQHTKGEPVSRNFSSDKDVPELSRLMDQRLLTRVRDIRHKVELMYRSSVKNRDRTEVLTINNPLPNFGESSHDSGVGRYIPSWALGGDGEEEEDEERGVVFSTHLPNRIEAGGETEEEEDDEEEELLGPETPEPLPALLEEGDDANYQVSAEQPPPTRGTNRLRSRTAPTPATPAMSADSFDFMLVKTRHARPKLKYENLPNKIHFMKESETREAGQFSRRQREMAEARARPDEFRGARPASAPGQEEEEERGKSAPSTRSPAPATMVTTQWAPLSMAALVDFKPDRQAHGEGDYNQGRAPVWPVGGHPVAVGQ